MSRPITYPPLPPTRRSSPDLHSSRLFPPTLQPTPVPLSVPIPSYTLSSFLTLLPPRTIPTQPLSPSPPPPPTSTSHRLHSLLPPHESTQPPKPYTPPSPTRSCARRATRTHYRRRTPVLTLTPVSNTLPHSPVTLTPSLDQPAQLHSATSPEHPQARDTLHSPCPHLHLITTVPSPNGPYRVCLAIRPPRSPDSAYQPDQTPNTPSRNLRPAPPLVLGQMAIIISSTRPQRLSFRFNKGHRDTSHLPRLVFLGLTAQRVQHRPVRHYGWSILNRPIYLKALKRTRR